MQRSVTAKWNSDFDYKHVNRRRAMWSLLEIAGILSAVFVFERT